jgi:endonuclease/exonuclease/phosphatase family metal-dependent hydrolase
VESAGDGTPFDLAPQTARSILVGDFNFPVDDHSYTDIQAPLASEHGYRDAWRIAHGHQPHTPTFCVHSTEYSKTPYCCDFAFVSGDLAKRVRDVQVDAVTQASDHQPVFLELDDH